jgi:hypothetical protein
MTNHKNPNEKPYQFTGWVCSDCAMIHANGINSLDWTPEQEEQYWKDVEVARVGVLNMALGDDVDPFSWRQCDGCGSTLGGERHEATFWLLPVDGVMAS